MVVIVEPPDALIAGTAGGFRRFGGTGGAERREGLLPEVLEGDETKTSTIWPSDEGLAIGSPFSKEDGDGAGRDDDVEILISGEGCFGFPLCICDECVGEGIGGRLCIVAATDTRLIVLLLCARSSALMTNLFLEEFEFDGWFADEDEDVDLRFSTLRLVLRSDFCRVGGLCGGDSGIKSLLDADVMLSAPGLATRLKLVGVVAVDSADSLALRSETHHSPARQRSTRRFVVGSMSRMEEFPTSDSSV